MTCDRYWREGVALVERGEPDPHRGTCADCRRAHEAHRELVHAVAELGAGETGDPQWQAKVWRQIEHERPARHVWRWAAAAVAATCTILLLWLGPRHSGHSQRQPAIARDVGRTDPVSLRQPPAGHDSLPRIEIISGPVAMRSTSARIGDRVRISAHPGDEIRIYRAERLMLRCSDRAMPEGCARSASGVTAETTFVTAGEYQLVVIPAATAELATHGAAFTTAASDGTLTTDLAPYITAGGDVQLTDLSIR